MSMPNLLRYLLFTAALFYPSYSLGGSIGPNISFPIDHALGRAMFAGTADPMTIYYNPAGLVLSNYTTFMVGLESTIATSRYLPDWNNAATETSGPSLTVVPLLGISSRLAHKGGIHPLPIALGLAFHNSFGSSSAFQSSLDQKHNNQSSTFLRELVPAIAYQINSMLALGIAARIGFISFERKNDDWVWQGTTRNPFDLSGDGTGFGIILGATFEPLEYLRLGMVYSGPMTVDIYGDGQVEIQLNPFQTEWRPDTFSTSIPFPQWAALGLTYMLGISQSLSLGIRWVDSSSFHDQIIHFNTINDLLERPDLSDGLSGYLGYELRLFPSKWTLNKAIALRAGGIFSSRTVPDKTMTRNQFDLNKLNLGAGASISLTSSWFVDLSFEYLFGFSRQVPTIQIAQDTQASTSQEVQVNELPGQYSFDLLSFGLNVRYVY